MTNFDFLKAEKRFDEFADVAVSAERLLTVDVCSCVLACRKAMEIAVKWMYSVDEDLATPYQDTLASMVQTEEFRGIGGVDLWRRMDYIRKIGNIAAHTGRKISEDQARLCLENLFYFLDFVAYCYGENYLAREFDASLLGGDTEQAEPATNVDVDEEVHIATKPDKLREELTAKREDKQPTYPQKPLELSEYATRKKYIDVMRSDAGWVQGVNWIDEYELPGMPNKSEVGDADYVLFGDDGKPLAVIEAKRTCVDISVGRQQAKLYADLLEKKFGQRPIIFLTNGFDNRIWHDAYYPERPVASIYSKRDLEKTFNLMTLRASLKNAIVDKNIADRYYQEGAIKAVCDSLENNRRKALVVMATGSGKTRTVIALTKILIDYGWVKNVLFLADRTALVKQAKRNFYSLYGDLSTTNLCEDHDNYNAHCVFSTYQTMMNCIDSVNDDQGKIYSVGHFDLVICDEAHRSIYNKYRDIFTYFDAFLVGLTATPKDEIDKNTYDVFELETGVPTYGYDLSQAIKDGYLVDFLSVETKLKFIEQGIVYDELSDEDKAVYEQTFEDENGELPESISSSALNEWIFNEDTIREVLNVLMADGLKVEYGNKIGKTIIFAKNHTHAEKILEVFNKEYPHLNGYAKVIDNYTNYAQSLIDEFSTPNKLPQIAISVDMLDTGIDIPEILNLVFFKKVFSKAKFWQMIGRGTRLCSGLVDGEDKTKFYIFDFCGNFEFFRINKGKPTANALALQGKIFNLKTQIVFKLQDLAYQTHDLVDFRKSLKDDLLKKVRELNRENFAVKQHLRYVEKFSDESAYEPLSYEDTLMMAEEIAPLVIPDEDEATALRFDSLMYGIELAYLVGKKYSRSRAELLSKVSDIASVANIPAIMMQAELINKILHENYIDDAGINEFEIIRKNLRDLIKYIPVNRIKFETDFDDEVLSIEYRESELENDDLKNYKLKAEYYVRQHQDSPTIFKLKNNIPPTKEDIEELENILWGELGSKSDYEAEFGKKPLGEFVREIVGLDMAAAKSVFNVFLKDINLDDKQIYFVNQIVEYIVHNGMMKDLSVLQEPPFTDLGSIVEVFADLTIWAKIRSAIDCVNINALAA